MKNFCKKNGLTENQFYGKEKIGGSLYLNGFTSIPDVFNPTVGGSLYLNGLTSIPDGFNPTIGGYLYLNGLTSIPDGFNPTVGGSLSLNGLTSIPDGFNPTIGGYLSLNGLTSIPDGFNPTVGGSLYLNGLTSIPDGFNPTIGGYLSLNGLTSIPDGFNPTVGGSLSLNGLTSIPDGFNPTIGGYLYLNGLTSNYTKFENQILTWENGKYILCDGIFAQVLSKKKRYYFIKKIGSNNKTYIVTDGKNTHSHGNTLKKANEDFQFKIISEKLKKEPIKEDTIINDNYYRLITGACEFGVKNWREQNNITVEEITAKELLPLLEKSNAYGLLKFKQLIKF